MIVEFAGIPRSGKTTSLDTARDFFNRAKNKNFTLRVLSEAARACPFPSSEYRLETACWTANKVLNDVIEASILSKRNTVTLQDRGLFDAMAFLELLKLEKQKLHLRPVSDFDFLVDSLLAYLSTWLNKVDLIILFDADPEESLRRDIAFQLSEKEVPGVITNIETLGLLQNAYTKVEKKYEDQVRVKRLNTTKKDHATTAKEVISVIKSRLEFSNL